MSHLLTSIGNMFEGLSFGTGAGKVAIGLGSVVAAFYSPIVALLVACFAFTTVDLIYGLKVARKQHKKIESSKSWKGTLTKILDEFTIISLARLLEFSVVGASGVFILTGGVTVIIGLTELWSILENLNTLNPDGPWRSLGKFLKKKGEEQIGFELEDLKDEDISTTDNSSKNSI